MEKQAEIVIMGYKAKIGAIRGAPASPPLSKHDELSVWIDLVDAADGCTGFFINIPVNNYGREELVKTITRTAEADLRGIIESSRRRHQEYDDREQRREELDHFGSQLMKMISE
jgi:hypothetical protein